MSGRIFTGRLRWHVAANTPVLQQETQSVNGGDVRWHDVPWEIDPPAVREAALRGVSAPRSQNDPDGYIQGAR